MTQFSYSFCMAMLHSFWQAALLLLLYVSIDKIMLQNNSPLAKRNFLYSSLAAQLILFTLTFIIYFSAAQGISSFAGFTQNMSSFFGLKNIRLITPWIFSLYIFIITYKLIKAIFSWYNFTRQYKTGLQKPAVDLKLFTELKAHQFGIKRKVKLWLSNSVNTPVTFGFFKPVILLPVALLNNISVQQAETLILHELTHIRTNDYLFNWFLLIAETIFFFNPFVAILCKKIRLEREKNCDMGVMAFEYSPALYAETLLQAERIKHLVPNFQLAAVNRKKHLLHRIQFFTNDKILDQKMRFNIVAPLVGLILLMLLSTAVLFQNGNTFSTGNTTSVMPYLPFNDFINTDTDLGKNILLNNSEKRLTEKIKNLESLTTIQNQKKKKNNIALQQLEKEITKVAEENQLDIATVIPVSIKENDAARQIIIKEESSGSSSVKVYYLSFENGQWVLQPEWIVTAKEIMIDSLSGKIDSLNNRLKRIFPKQQ